MKSVSTFHSPPPSPQAAPLPLSSTSSLTACPELDLSVTQSPAPKPGQTHHKTRPLRPGKHVKPRLQGQAGQKGETQCVSVVQQVCVQEPVIVTVIPESHISATRAAAPPPQQARSRRTRRKDLSRAVKQVIVSPAEESNQEPGCLERAELNTTLALKAELQSTQEAEFNSQKAVQETLQKSERTKNLINTRATEVVNVSRSQVLFNSLVSVDVQEDQLISQVLQDRLLLAPPPRCHESRPLEGPSLLAFVTPDLLRQKPLPLEEEPVACKPHPSPRPAHTTFDLYRRQRCWEATP